MGRVSPSVLFVHSSDELYGADRMLLEMVEAAVSAGAEVAVWLPTDLDHPTPSLCTRLEERGARVEHVDLPVMRRAYLSPGGLAALARRARRFRSAVRSAAPDVLYCATSAMFVCAAVARRRSGPRIVGHVQEIWPTADRRMLGPLARACHELIAISEPVVQSLPTGLRARAAVVANGTVDPGTPTPVAPEGELRLVVASRWNGWKGHRTLLQAWRDAGEPGTLTVLGGPPASGEAVDVPALVAEWGLSASVRVVGEVPDIGPVISESDVVVMPSDRPEPFGLVAIEAFARGRPVIASAGGGLQDIVTDGVDGWLFPMADPAALATLLGSLDRTAVVEAGRVARRSFEERFSAEAFADRWTGVLRLR